VAEPLPVTERELRFLRELVRCQVAFLIVGLSAAALQGAPVVTQDVDLWFRNLDDPNLAAALRRVGGAYVAPTGRTPPMLAGEGLELFDIVLRMDGLRSFDEECAAAVELTIGDVVTKVLPLPRILASKRAAARPKDRLVVPVLEEMVALLPAARDLKNP
jgi:hypothetical protein